MGRRDDDAVGEALALEALGAVGRTVVGQDGLGDHRGGHEVVTGVDAHVHAVGDEHLDGGLLGRAGQRVGVGAEVQRAGDTGLLAVFGDGLEMAMMWASLNEVFRDDPRWPEVPKMTRCSGTSGSGTRS